MINNKKQFFQPQFKNLINLQSLDAKEFLQTHLEIQQNSTTILTSQTSAETVVKVFSNDQPNFVSENSGASNLLSDGGGYLSSHQSEDFFILKKESFKQKLEKIQGGKKNV